jgi:hypothetical protein
MAAALAPETTYYYNVIVHIIIQENIPCVINKKSKWFVVEKDRSYSCAP